MPRVQKLLSNYGYCSRRKAEQLIKDGRVKVNNRIACLGDNASLDDKIRVDNKPIRKQAKVYLMFNKPLGCVTASTDKKFRTVMDYVKIKERVFPVGRLDYNTSGLLLLTNDGDFANKVMHPRYETKKTYLVEIDRPIDQAEIGLIRNGIYLRDGKTNPAEVKQHSPLLLEVVIHEGRKRIIRRMFKKLRFEVKALKRIKIGGLSLGNLKPGKYSLLSESDKKKIFQ
jgi:23S rRNA pseudouridine2605 synthase